MASIQHRRLASDASEEEVRKTINRLADVLFGNRGGRVILSGDDGLERDLRGGLELSADNSALFIQSAVGLHTEMLNSLDDSIVLKAEDDGVTINTLDVAGDAAIGGALAVAGTLDVTGATTVTALTASGAATFSGPTITLGDAAGDVITVNGTPTFAQLATFALGATLSGGNLTFSGTAQRIGGDFSNGTSASRVLFQTSSANGATIVGAIPNGSGALGGFAAYAGSNPNAATAGLFLVDTTSVAIHSTATGGATLRPLTFWTNNVEQMRIAANGDITIGPSGGKIGVFGTSPVARQSIAAAATDPATTMALVNQIRTRLISYGWLS